MYKLLIPERTQWGSWHKSFSVSPEKRTISCIAVKKVVTVISDSSPPGHSGREEYLNNLAATRLQPLPVVSTEELTM